MTTPELTTLARFPARLIRFGQSLGLDRSELLEAAALTDGQLKDPDSRIPVTSVAGLWWFIVNHVPDPDLGVRYGSGRRIKQVGLVGFTMQFSRTLYDALRRLVRYRYILSERIELILTELTDDDEPVTLEGNDPNFYTLPPQAVDAELCSILAVSREITGTDLAPVEVLLPYGKPESTQAHEAFFRAPLKFGHANAGLVFRRQDMDLPIVAADEELIHYLDEHAEEVLQGIEPGGSFPEQVRRALWHQLSAGKPTLKGLATELGMSTRTLQRRLSESETSFAGLLDAFRRDMAVRLLLDRHLAVYEVAFLLGYSEPSTFYRAFKRWMNVSPQEFRRSMESK